MVECKYKERKEMYIIKAVFKQNPIWKDTLSNILYVANSPLGLTSNVGHAMKFDEIAAGAVRNALTTVSDYSVVEFFIDDVRR